MTVSPRARILVLVCWPYSSSGNYLLPPQIPPAVSIGYGLLRSLAETAVPGCCARLSSCCRRWVTGLIPGAGPALRGGRSAACRNTAAPGDHTGSVPRLSPLFYPLGLAEPRLAHTEMDFASLSTMSAAWPSTSCWSIDVLTHLENTCSSHRRVEAQDPSPPG